MTSGKCRMEGEHVKAIACADWVGCAARGSCHVHDLLNDLHIGSRFSALGPAEIRTDPHVCVWGSLLVFQPASLLSSSYRLCGTLVQQVRRFQTDFMCKFGQSLRSFGSITATPRIKSWWLRGQHGSSRHHTHRSFQRSLIGRYAQS